MSAIPHCASSSFIDTERRQYHINKQLAREEFNKDLPIDSGEQCDDLWSRQTLSDQKRWK
ncbi:hypothetical protein KIN20_020511 [Parelaphostrongylus tenuis]|uniref:Uncharacterized protein n=1 Tax=Parelaphostrongylus tenuis TaxID=148309 RepID=A0AAD5MMK2_PARTN|nr:hypothetical protein KIN20_020511 [Parelaphostrongylus tenuis]